MEWNIATLGVYNNAYRSGVKFGSERVVHVFSHIQRTFDKHYCIVRTIATLEFEVDS